jgi:hypothetical protein
VEGNSANLQSQIGAAYGNMQSPSSGTDTGAPSGVVLDPASQHPVTEGCVHLMLLTAVAICCQTTPGFFF